MQISGTEAIRTQNQPCGPESVTPMQTVTPVTKCVSG